MRSDKIFVCLAAMGVCLLILIGGCVPAEKETTKPEVGLEKQMPKVAIPEVAKLTLQLIPQDSTNYKVTTQAERSVRWEGPLPDGVDSRESRKCSKAELTFTKQIQTVNDKGNAIVKITINNLKYSSVIKGSTIIDFDSSRDTEPNNPLAKLIGQSYTIESAPTGEVIDIVDVNQAKTAVGDGSSTSQMALMLLSPEAIKERHGIIVLPPADRNQLRTGGNWSGVKTFFFDFMGSKSFERIYTLKEITDTNNLVAIVDMNAIPTSKMAEQLHKEQTTTDLSKVFDSTGTYTGQLEFDLTAGKVKKYHEKLQSEWIAVDPNPSTGREGDEEPAEPAALRLGEIRLYSLERIS